MKPLKSSAKICCLFEWKQNDIGWKPEQYDDKL